MVRRVRTRQSPRARRGCVRAGSAPLWRTHKKLELSAKLRRPLVALLLSINALRWVSVTVETSSPRDRSAPLGLVTIQIAPIFHQDFERSSAERPPRGTAAPHRVNLNTAGTRRCNHPLERRAIQVRPPVRTPYVVIARWRAQREVQRIARGIAVQALKKTRAGCVALLGRRPPAEVVMDAKTVKQPGVAWEDRTRGQWRTWGQDVRPHSDGSRVLDVGSVG